MLLKDIIFTFIVLTFFEFLFHINPIIPKTDKLAKIIKVKIVKKFKSIVLAIVPTTNFINTRQYIGTNALKYRKTFFITILLTQKHIFM